MPRSTSASSASSSRRSRCSTPTARPVTNVVSGWPDSYWYDIDLTLAVLREPDSTGRGLIAYCPEAFTPESRELLAGLDTVDTIEIAEQEASEAFACNLVSTGTTVVMSDQRAAAARRRRERRPVGHHPARRRARQGRRLHPLHQPLDLRTPGQGRCRARACRSWRRSRTSSGV